MTSYKGAHRLSDAQRVASRVVELLRPNVDRIEVCGSIRRRRLTVGDVDIVAVAKDPQKVRECIAALGGDLPQVKGLVIVDGIAVDVALVSAEGWGAALCHATGPKEENIRLRQVAVRRGLMVSQYGVFKRDTKERVAGETEESVYAALGLPYVPPQDRDVSSRRITSAENARVLAGVPQAA